jgi:hypothetical protein
LKKGRLSRGTCFAVGDSLLFAAGNGLNPSTNRPSAVRAERVLTAIIAAEPLFAGAGAVLSFFGFIHGTSLGIGNSAPVALGYLIVAGVCYALSTQNYAAAVISAEGACARRRRGLIAADRIGAVSLRGAAGDDAISCRGVSIGTRLLRCARNDSWRAAVRSDRNLR